MKLTEVRDHIATLYRSGIRYTVCLQGPPGIGKSAMVRAAAESLGIDFLAPPPLPVIDPLDLGGIGAVVGLESAHPKALRLPFGDLIPSEGKGFILFDDITTAPTLTQAALYSLVWERRVGAAKLGPDWQIICTANRDEDNAATNPIPTPLVNRMEFLPVEYDFAGWEEMMASKGASPIVRSYLHNSPQSFSDFDPSRPGPFASPRSWENLATLFDAYAPKLPPRAAVGGWVGEGMALQVIAFATAHHAIVSPDQVLANPSTAPVPRDLGALTVILTALANASTHHNIDAIITYCNRTSVELATYCLRAAINLDTARLEEVRKITPDKVRNYPLLTAQAAFKKWLNDHQDIFAT